MNIARRASEMCWWYARNIAEFEYDERDLMLVANSFIKDANELDDFVEVLKEFIADEMRDHIDNK